MTPLVPITMFGWIPVVLGIFVKFKPRQAVIIAFLSAWMFLPIVEYPLPGLPDYTKISATCLGIFIAAFVFDQNRILSFRPSIVDTPMIIWCVCPLISSITNGLGLYDGMATLLRYVFTWGFPYLVGRLYFSDLTGLREFALGILIGGLVYVPLCLLENLISPQLHFLLYGFYQHSFAQTYRWGGWRPMVFMDHGLMVAVWMMSAFLVGFWMWMTGALKKINKFPIAWIVVVLLFTFLMARSTGAWALALMGGGVLLSVKKLKRSILVTCLVMIPVLYMGFRATGLWDGYNLQKFVAENISMDRALSLYTRMENENIVVEKSLQRPLFGWGGWGRSRVYDEEGTDITVTDGLWIIILGEHGLVGLSVFTLVFLLPIGLFLRHYPVKTWILPQVAPAAVLSILLVLYMIDCLLNAMVNPIFTVAAGGLTGLKKERGYSEAINTPQGVSIVRTSENLRFL
jgi:hypothetical protein